MSVNLSVVHHCLMACSCGWVVNSKTCSHLLMATYNMNCTCQIGALINALTHD